MTVQVKICGIKTAEALATAAEAGAEFIGLNFYAPSPRAVTPAQAAALIAGAPAGLIKVGLFVDADDVLLERTLAEAKLDMLQFHGHETPERVATLRARFGIAVMKVLKISQAEDFDPAGDFATVADWLMFDAVPPKDKKNALPGGNAASFDWTLLRGRTFPKPWMLAGGLNPGNVAEAIRISGAPCVDVSSGVETAPGEKDPARMCAFIRAAKAGG